MLTVGVLVIALATRAALAAQARDWLAYTFRGVPARPDDGGGDLRATTPASSLGVLGLLLIAQLAARRAGGPTRAQLAAAQSAAS